MKIPISGDIIPGPAGESSLRLEEPLGGGAFGVVFKAREITSEILYAVKFPQSAVFGGEPEMAAFLNEVQAAREIQHPNIVSVMHVETRAADLPPYLVLEFVADGTLKSRLDILRASGGLVDLALLRAWTNGLIDGIAAINAKMLHRDLKPDNILMDGNTPKIGDFGLSKIIGAMTRSQTFKGGQHILYMAPEGWKLETNQIQVDMYAMGIVLYEMAALRYPYKLPSDFRDIDAIRSMHLFEQAQSLREIRPDLPFGFAHVVFRLMEKRPEDRFPHWSKVKESLEKAWEAGDAQGGRPRQLVTTLLEEVGRVHETNTRQRVEEEKHAAEQAEQQQLDIFQKEKLINGIRDAITEFNQSSTFGQIREFY